MNVLVKKTTCQAMKKLILITFFWAVLALRCDKGLAPQAETTTFTGISGTIFFQNWPPADSLVDLRLVAFKKFQPKFTAQDIFIQILSDPPEAFTYPGLSDTTRIPADVDKFDFDFELPAGTYEYLVVAHRYGPDILADWQAAGQYDVDADSLPSPITVTEGKVIQNVLISVDFHDLPMQPF
jgi:hypothetical protein